MIYYLDTCALLKFVKAEKESAALKAWRLALGEAAELVTNELAELEITRALLRGGRDKTQVPYFARKALDGIFLTLLTRPLVLRAISYEVPKLGSLDAIHLATAEPLREHLSAFVTYDKELAEAAQDLGLPVEAPS